MLSSSWRNEPQASAQLPKAADTPMSEAAGMVVTEMNTPMIVLDRASVSEITPTTPARAATMRENQLGVSIRFETGRTPTCTPQAPARPNGPRATAATQQQLPGEANHQCSRAACHSREIIACRPKGEAENGAVFRADHHGADNQDLRVGKDPHSTDQPRDDEQRVPAWREDSLSRSLASTSAQTGANRWNRPRLADMRSASVEIDVSTFSITIEPR